MSNPEHISAGGVVINDEGRVLLLHRKESDHWRYDSWHLPKGTRQSEETLEQTATREVEEETGYQVKIINYLGSLPSTYDRDGQIVQKLTHYYLMEPIKQTGPVTEHDGLSWMTIADAKDKLSQFPIWEKEQEILETYENSRHRN